MEKISALHVISRMFLLKLVFDVSRWKLIEGASCRHWEFAEKSADP